MYFINSFGVSSWFSILIKCCQVEEFRLRGEDLRLDVKEGAYSMGDSLISLYDAQQTDELLAKQPKWDLISESDSCSKYEQL